MCRDRALSRFTVLLATLAGADACSFLVEQDATQCNVLEDCQRGPAFAGSICTVHHACERLTCETNTECAKASGVPSVCRHGTCAALLSRDCQTLLGDKADLQGDSVLWLGMLAPLDAANVPLTQAKENALDLARRDFNIRAGGLPALGQAVQRRPFAFVVCDQSADVDRAALHLVSDVGVPAIVGPTHSGDLIRAATEVTIPAGVLLISSAATSPFITDLPNKNGLVWRTAPSDTVQARAITLLLTMLEPDLDKTLLTNGERLRVAVVHKGDAYGVGLQVALRDQLQFNGKSASENSKVFAYRAIDYGDPEDPNDTSAAESYRQTVSQLTSFEPHVIILAGTTESVTDIFAPLEQSWPAAASFRPRYFLTDGAYPRRELLTAVGSNEELRKRILGTAPGTRSKLYTNFLATYASVFPNGPEAIETTAGTYDAAYLLAYSIASLRGAEITGSNIRDGLQRLVPPGPSIAVGPEGISQAFDVLTRNGVDHIDFDGASGPLDFDVRTGDAEADTQVWCIGPDDAYADSGLSYNAKTHALEGVQICP